MERWVDIDIDRICVVAQARTAGCRPDLNSCCGFGPVGIVCVVVSALF